MLISPEYFFAAALLLLGSIEAHGAGKAVVQREPWYSTKDQTTWASASIQGSSVTINPSQASFAVPQKWVEWNAFGYHFHLTRPQIDAAARGHGEWDTEYASVVNAVLPFDRCAGHMGDAGWGEQGVSFADLQMRVYDLAQPPEHVEKRIRENGFADIKRFTGKEPTLEQDLKAHWRRTKLAYNLFYGDYGGTAHVDFRVKRFGKRTLVFVFLYSDYGPQEQTITSILDSVVIRAVPN